MMILWLYNEISAAMTYDLRSGLYTTDIAWSLVFGYAFGVLRGVLWRMIGTYLYSLLTHDHDHDQQHDHDLDFFHFLIVTHNWRDSACLNMLSVGLCKWNFIFWQLADDECSCLYPCSQYCTFSCFYSITWNSRYRCYRPSRLDLKVATVSSPMLKLDFAQHKYPQLIWSLVLRSIPNHNGS